MLPSDDYIDNLSTKLEIDTQHVLKMFLKQSYIYDFHPTHRKNSTNFSRLAIFHSNEGVDRCFPRPTNQPTATRWDGKRKEKERKKNGEEKRNNNKTRRIEYSQKENECRLQSIQLAGPRPKTVDASRLKRRPRSSWATTLSPCPQLVREHSTHPPVAFPPGVTVSSGREDYSSPLGWPSTGIVASLRGFVHSPPFETSHSRLRLEKIRLRGLPRDRKRKSRFFWGSDSSR